ncbi:hypothetical protein C8A05DRAFT_15909 [Staphylotrichum tortipilum]|uniref:Uncharacterized protein n=1 Tax=Staphylotrichum tortipilum TaxID=2831512 RepID=A0AAN6MJD7_9PEZI|nr:hypothetical protein C8A05DRAFT_15909 [Staphylotrichum longicolle]
MIVLPAPTPTPTSTSPGLVSAHTLAHLQPRQTDYLGSDCFNYNAGLGCTSILTGCDFGGAATNYNSVVTACLCTYGIPYLDCFYSQIATGTCASYYFGTAGYADYQLSFYSEYCGGTVPPSAMAHIQAPTSVSLSLATVKVTTAPGALKQPNFNAAPNYSGTGELLKGPCSSTSFTLVDATSTVYYAGFIGCNRDRPECCPWSVAQQGVAAGGAATNSAGNLLYDLPKPANSDLAQLASCADDYYSISGGCCPNGFWPFTSAVGGITPCWSSKTSIRAPTLTVEKDAKSMDKPTSAVVNIVWAMRYPVADTSGSSGGLSTAAKAGIGAGAGVAVILIAALAICLWRSKRKNKALTPDPAAAAAAAAAFPPPGQQPPPMMQQQPNGQYPPSLAPGVALSPSDHASIMTSTTTPLSAAALVPQNTGTSGGAVSELSSSQSGPNAGYFPPGANPRQMPAHEMSAMREAEPPQEVMGSQVPVAAQQGQK